MEWNKDRKKEVLITGFNELLHNTELFSFLDESKLCQLARSARIIDVKKGGYLFFQGDEADSVYVVARGLIQIVLTNFDGRELVINEMKPGECFGELAIITGQTRSSGALARQDSKVVVIPQSVFKQLLDTEPVLVRKLLDMTSRWLYQSNERESALAFLDAEARLGRVLVKMERDSGAKGYVTISQEALAQRASVTRQTAAKILGKWRRKGWIITGRGHIMILSPQLLENPT